MTPEEQKAYDEAIAASKTAQETLASAKKAADEFKADMLKRKDEAAALQAKLAEIEAEKKKQEEGKLASEGQFKTLLENEKKTHGETKAELEKFKKGFIATQIESDVERTALAMGLNPKNRDLLLAMPRDTVKAEFVTSGNGTKIQVVGAENMVEAFKTLHPELFGKGTAAGVDSGTGDAGIDGKKPAELTSDDLAALEKKDPEKFKQILAGLLGKK